MKKSWIVLLSGFMLVGSIGCGETTGGTKGLLSSNKHNLTMSKCKSIYGDYTQSKWANEIGYGDNKPLTNACYQALVAGPRLGIDGQMYIDSYNQGTYDLIEGAMNNNNSDFSKAMMEIQSLSYEECNKLFIEYDSDEINDLIVFTTNEALRDDISDNAKERYKLTAATGVHCRKVLYNE